MACWFLTKFEGLDNGERIIILINGIWTGYQKKKRNLDVNFIPHAKINSKWIIDVNAETEL